MEIMTLSNEEIPRSNICCLAISNSNYLIIIHIKDTFSKHYFLMIVASIFWMMNEVKHVS
jgi:hypothetical protein